MYHRRTLSSKTIFGYSKPFKNDEKCSLFHFKHSFRSQDIRIIILNSNFMTSQQIIAIHISPNFSKSKDNQRMKFGQFIEYNMRNIFLEKSCTECDGETSSRSSPEKLKLSISLDQ